MLKLNIWLLLAALACSLLVVANEHQNRRLKSHIERERSLSLKLDNEFKALQLEQSSLGAHVRVEQMARDRLNMRQPEQVPPLYMPR